MKDLSSLAHAREAGTTVNIVHTTLESTSAALTTASSFSRDLEITIRVLAFQVVPFPLNIDEPAVCPDFAINRILDGLQDHTDVEFFLEYIVCRDRDDALIRSLTKESVVVIGVRHGLIPTKEQRIARKLEDLGHQVVFVRR